MSTLFHNAYFTTSTIILNKWTIKTVMSDCSTENTTRTNCKLNLKSDLFGSNVGTQLIYIFMD